MSDMNQDDDLFGDIDEESAGEPAPRETRGKAPSNRPFLMVIGFIGLLLLLAVGVAAVYTMVILPRQNASRVQQAAEINAQNTLTVMAATDSAFVMAQTVLAPTSTIKPLAAVSTAVPTATAQTTPTSVVVFATATPDPAQKAADLGGAADPAARTQTVAALLTQAAQGMPTTAAAAGAAAQASTALPTTGFADEIGLPGMLGFAVLLVAVAFAARRLRSAGN